MAPALAPPKSDCFERNLACLGERNADLAAKIASIEPARDFQLIETSQGVCSASLGGKLLASRHRPLDEAAHIVDSIDLVEHAVVVVLGFGMGWHVRRLAQRMGRAGLIVIFEPDVALLRAVFEHVDHSSWLRDGLIVWVSDAEDRGMLARKLQGAESIIAQGVELLEHGPSRSRPLFAQQSAQFAALFREHVAAAKTTLVTTLVRSVDTISNLLHNIDHYVGGEGVAELSNAAADFPAIIVSAGPSLRRNIEQLAHPRVRERCVIIAVQTVLKPLLARGIRPHFVTALDYHEISGRFYEGLTPDDVRGVTLVADPKVHPVVLDSFPGAVRCCASPFLDELLGERARDMGVLPAGATVAHLAVYLAHHLGCNPIALIGQDLAFTDGLYYAPGTAIHDEWAPELNPFNTIEMMEWQRIARHRRHLHKVRDIHGRTIYSDAQMTTYRQQFERDFAGYRAMGVSIIDATDGGAAKQHTERMALREVIHRFASKPVPSFQDTSRAPDARRMAAARPRISSVRHELRAIRRISRQTAGLIRRMLDDQHESAGMKRHFHMIDANRKQIEKRMASFELLNHINQLGAFKRLTADRRLHMQFDTAGLERQRLQLQRDLENVLWIADAAGELIEQLGDAERLLRGERVERDRKSSARKAIINDVGANDQSDVGVVKVAGPIRAAAMIAIDPQRNGLGVPRSLADSFAGRAVLQATLERLGQSRNLQSIVLIAPEGFDVEALMNRDRIALPVEIEHCDGSPLPPYRHAIAAARLWSDSSWRGGLGGMTIYDEVLAPHVTSRVMDQRGITAAVVCGPDWPLIDVSAESGCDAVIERHRAHPAQHKLVFTQAPPGICGCVISDSLMRELARGTRLSTVGALLSYQPRLPQADPIARDCCVRTPSQIRHAQIRATFDSTRWRAVLRSACESIWTQTTPAAEFIAAIEREMSARPSTLPQHVTIELASQRASSGQFSRSMQTPPRPTHMSWKTACQLLDQLSDIDDCAVTFAGRGDPLQHEQFSQIVQHARKSAGIKGIHVRTELRCEQSAIDELINSGVDVVSVDLHADRAATYKAMMGDDQFRTVLINLEYLCVRRRRLGDVPEGAGFGLPWIVPRIQRCSQTLDDVDCFFDRWLHQVGAAVIDPAPGRAEVMPLPETESDSILSTETPPAAVRREAFRSMTIFADGSVPQDGYGITPKHCAGNATDQSVAELWMTLQEARCASIVADHELAAGERIAAR